MQPLLVARFTGEPVRMPSRHHFAVSRSRRAEPDDATRDRQTRDIARAIRARRGPRFAAVAQETDEVATELMRRALERGRKKGLTGAALLELLRKVAKMLGADGWATASLAKESFESVLMGTYQATTRATLASDLLLPVTPYTSYWTVGDAVVRPTHRLLHGFTARTSWSGWLAIMPPNGWNCRCWLVAASFLEARRRRWTAEIPDVRDLERVDRFIAAGGADKGFDKAPFLALSLA